MSLRKIQERVTEGNAFGEDDEVILDDEDPNADLKQFRFEEEDEDASSEEKEDEEEEENNDDSEDDRQSMTSEESMDSIDRPLSVVDEDDEERRLEVLRIFQMRLEKMPDLFDETDIKAIGKEIHRLENSKKRLWKRQCRERLKVLSEFERVLGLRKNHPKLNDFFVNKHRKMERMISKLN